MSKSQKTKKSGSAASPAKGKSATADKKVKKAVTAKSSSPVRKEAIKSEPVDAQPNKERSAVLLIHNLNQFIADTFDASTGGMPTTTQYELMNAIQSLDGPNQTQLGNATLMDRSTVAEVVKRLVTRGYVDRKRLPSDERAFVITLTDKGKEALSRGHKAMRTVQEKLDSVPGFASAAKWATTVLKEHGRKDMSRGTNSSPKITRTGPVGGIPTSGSGSTGNLGSARTRPFVSDDADADAHDRADAA